MLLLILVPMISQLPTGSGIDMEWTKYSDAADLPMSERWYEDMRQRLATIDTEKLSPQMKMKYKQLSRRLNKRPGGDDGGEDGDWWQQPHVVVLLLLVVGVAYWLYNGGATVGGSKGQHLGGNGGTPQTITSGFGASGPTPEQLREYRRIAFATND
eukprot:TRINITY_DN44775_c0_g1_i1.p1 TRINITY_DN44775_c0_g1~~TRINITY_DN44775_c0_g1_i1.p1  ORF type:complete len:156 (+),score=26.38 TRINITY_DN44775_c0_g1_i1:184-651(+)